MATPQRPILEKPESLAAKPKRCLFRAIKVEGQKARQRLVLAYVRRPAMGPGSWAADRSVRVVPPH